MLPTAHASLQSARLPRQPRSTAISTDAYPTPPTLEGHSPAPSQTSSVTNGESIDLTHIPSFHLHPVSLPTQPQIAHADEGFIDLDPQLEATRTWPVGRADLQVPPRTTRERSTSQPDQTHLLEPKVSYTRAKSLSLSSKMHSPHLRPSEIRSLSMSPQIL
ncbi:uncharacterized protein EI97DRAFT_19445 [Westerdykella ornata]|uniref:Uncharacterized protein n=1 Tax=Westerdykella ornata TaxID=318751 RepID=A0A6A6JY94_WESOR|nr:uncharacterized protein EI97DRAFT_19445 [Westerdykella ornata]KAF2281063.1 hypothetical protein EI97DRAFT_19445 [Westerdykella ornata]